MSDNFGYYDNQVIRDGYVQGDGYDRRPPDDIYRQNPETYGQPSGNPDAGAGNSHFNQARFAADQEAAYQRDLHEQRYLPGPVGTSRPRSVPVPIVRTRHLPDFSDPNRLTTPTLKLKKPRKPKKSKPPKLSKRDKMRAEEWGRLQALVAKSQTVQASRPTSSAPESPTLSRRGRVLGCLVVLALAAVVILGWPTSDTHSAGTPPSITAPTAPVATSTFTGTAATTVDAGIRTQVTLNKAETYDANISVPYDITNASGGTVTNPSTAYLQVTVAGNTFVEYPMSTPQSAEAASHYDGRWTFRYYLPGSYTLHYTPGETGQDIAVHVGDSNLVVQAIIPTNDPGSFAVVQQSGVNNTVLWARVVIAYRGAPPMSHFTANGQTTPATGIGPGIASSLANPTYQYSVETDQLLHGTSADYFFGGNESLPVHIGP